MESDNKAVHVLDVDYIQKNLDEGFKYIEEAKRRDLVLVIGNTGVGKSTTCNYLLGHQMKEIKHEGWKDVIETVDETDIKIGHATMSETLYAKTVLVNDNSFLSWDRNNDICLLDCPGFEGNRTEEERVIESISTELAIRNAHQIRGILILMSLPGLKESRQEEVRKLVKTLIRLFKNPVEMVRYSVFLVTKKEKYELEEARNIAIGALHSIKNHSLIQAQRLSQNESLHSSENLTHVDYDRIATYFSEVLERDNNILIINPLDAGESRKLVFDRINSIKPRIGYLRKMVCAGMNILYTMGVKTNPQNQQICPITINDFNFSQYDENRHKFNKALYGRAHDGFLLIKEICENVEKSLTFCSDLSNLKERLSLLKELQSNLEKENRNPNVEKDLKSILNLKSIILKNKNRIALIKCKIKEKSSILQYLNENLIKIDTDLATIFMKKDIDTSVSWWKLFGWEEMVFSADTKSSSVPIISVSKEMENGAWINIENRQEEGIYKITYQSHFRAKPARASVTAYIETRDEAGNKIRIKEINDAIAKLEKHKLKLELEIEDIKSRNETLEKIVQSAKDSIEEYKKNTKQRLKECENDIKLNNCILEKMKNDKNEANISGLKYLQELLENRHKFDIVVAISALLEFPSPLINDFVTQYKKCLTAADHYKCIFEESDVMSSSVPSRENFKDVNSLKDPTTKDEIKDSEMHQMMLDELQKKKTGLIHEMNSMKEQLKIKTTEFDNICQQIENLQCTELAPILEFD